MRKMGVLNAVIQVRKGYAKNFLIPNGYACLATQANILQIESSKIELQKQDGNLTADAETLKDQIEGIKITFYNKTKDAQNIYGSIAAQNISEKLIALGYNINKSQILLGKNLKTLGTHEVKVSLYGSIEANISAVIKSIADAHADKQAYKTV